MKNKDTDQPDETKKRRSRLKNPPPKKRKIAVIEKKLEGKLYTSILGPPVIFLPIYYISRFIYSTNSGR